MDQFDEIFKLQRELNKKIGSDTGQTKSSQEKKEWILNYARAMNQEIAELTDSVPWKWWAKYQEFDEQNVAVELVDILHFLVSAFQVMDLDAKDVYEIYTQKHKVNVDRQHDGYESKDQGDCKHIGV